MTVVASESQYFRVRVKVLVVAVGSAAISWRRETSEKPVSVYAWSVPSMSEVFLAIWG